MTDSSPSASPITYIAFKHWYERPSQPVPAILELKVLLGEGSAMEESPTPPITTAREERQTWTVCEGDLVERRDPGTSTNPRTIEELSECVTPAEETDDE